MSGCFYPFVANRRTIQKYQRGDEFPLRSPSLKCQSRTAAAKMALAAARKIPGASAYVVELRASRMRHHVAGWFEVTADRSDNPSSGIELTSDQIKALYDQFNAEMGFGAAVSAIAKAGLVSSKDRSLIQSAFAKKRSPREIEEAKAHRAAVAQRVEHLIEAHNGNLTKAYLEVREKDGDVNKGAAQRIRSLMKSCPMCEGETKAQRDEALKKVRKETDKQKAKREEAAKAAEKRAQAKAAKDRAREEKAKQPKRMTKKQELSEQMQKVLAAQKKAGEAKVETTHETKPEPKVESVEIVKESPIEVPTSSVPTDGLTQAEKSALQDIERSLASLVASLKD